MTSILDSKEVGSAVDVVVDVVIAVDDEGATVVVVGLGSLGWARSLAEHALTARPATTRHDATLQDDRPTGTRSS